MCEFSSLIRLLERGVFFFLRLSCLFGTEKKKEENDKTDSALPPLCKPVYDNVTR